jgi:hypothetical protein
MLRRLAYACVCRSVGDSSPRGTMLRNATHGTRMFRLSSDIVPFGSQPVKTIPWWGEFAEPLAPMGEQLRTSGMRVSRHPGQYAGLSSPDPRILDTGGPTWCFPRGCSMRSVRTRATKSWSTWAARTPTRPPGLAPADLEFDCMLEAKAKDPALFRVRDALGIAA